MRLSAAHSHPELAPCRGRCTLRTWTASPTPGCVSRTTTLSRSARQRVRLGVLRRSPYEFSSEYYTSCKLDSALLPCARSDIHSQCRGHPCRNACRFRLDDRPIRDATRHAGQRHHQRHALGGCTGGDLPAAEPQGCRVRHGDVREVAPRHVTEDCARFPFVGIWCRTSEIDARIAGEHRKSRGARNVDVRYSLISIFSRVAQFGVPQRQSN